MDNVCSEIWVGLEHSSLVNSTSVTSQLPSLSRCIQDTLLTWPPALYLIIVLPIYVHGTTSERGVVPTSPLNLTRQILTVLLFITSMVQLGGQVYVLTQDDDRGAWHGVLAAVLQAVCMVLVGVGAEVDRRRGVRSSIFLLVFWILTTLSAVFVLWSQAAVKTWTGDIVLWSTSCVYYTVGAVQLVLCAAIDKQPTGGTENMSDFSVPDPIFYRSSFIRLFLLHPFRIIREGYKRTLCIDDLWSLRPQYHAKNTFVRLQATWDREILKSFRSGAKSKRKSKSSSIPLLHHKRTSQTSPGVSTASPGVHNTKAMHYQPSLLKAIVKTYAAPFSLIVALRAMVEVFIFTNPIILRYIIQFVQSDSVRTEWEGYLYALLLFCLSISEAVLTNHLQFLHFTTNIKVRGSVMSVIYNKALKLSASARKYSTLGEIVNLMAVDALKYMEFMHFVNMMWVFPVQVGVALYFLWGLLGPASLAGVAAFSCMSPIKFYLGRLNKRLQTKQMKYKDERIKLTNEILSGIKVLKLYAWELSFEAQVKRLRQKELRVMQLQTLIAALLNFIFNLGPFLIALVSFAVYVLSSPDHVLTAEVAFVSLAYFNILRTPLQILPNLINNMIQANVSHNRIYKFLLKEEVDSSAIERDEAKKGCPVSVSEGCFTWDPATPPLLNNINMEVRQGSLVAIVGSVGAGKSSLLSALLGEMHKAAGKVHVKGSIAYVPQQAWIQQATLRDNVLFSKAYDAERYTKILEDCALMPDLDILPGRDETEIGERGINLSGGQKCRVSLARAVYQDADLYLLDDPLSAVDAHVGKSIFQNVLGPEGHLSKKTRIMVTHSMWFLPEVDEIFVIENGEILEHGSYGELMKGGVFSDMMSAYENTFNTEVHQAAELPSVSPVVGSPEKTEFLSQSSIPSPTTHHPKRTINNGIVTFRGIHRAVSVDQHLPPEDGKVRQKCINFSPSSHNPRQDGARDARSGMLTEHYASHSSLPGSRLDVNDQLVEENEEEAEEEERTEKEKGELVEDEEIERGKVKLSVYTTYLRAIGLLSGCLVIGLSLFTVGFNLAASVWLSLWSDAASEVIIDANITVNSSDHQPINQAYYLSFYAVLGAMQALGSASRWGLGVYAGLRTSRVQHQRLLRSVLRSPMSFFDRTPLGRILNRFSADVAAMDSTLPGLWVMVLTLTFDALGTVVLIGVITPWSLIAWVVLGAVFIWIQMFYVATQRQGQRLLSIHRSPVYAHFDESLAGMSTIRAYAQQQRFLSECESRVDKWGRCAYFSINCNRWLGVVLNLIGSVVIFLSAVMVISFRHQLSSGLVALALTYALTITGMLQMLVRHCALLESQIVSVERIVQYLNLTHEAAWSVEDKQPEPEWPDSGQVVLHNVGLRYRDKLDLVLKSISFSIGSGEKVGVVGRTGAGKSSLTMALFRIVELAEGTIHIDDINISEIGLHDLRSKLTVIPQDPVLFSGTLRLNLDPFDVYTDEQVWSSLKQAHLCDWVSRLPDQLQHVCNEGGENLSVGQRQLVCLARALLRRTKLLILDEATAACDVETDELIQSTIRTEFTGSTVLTIAHRLNTIVDYDRILVLSEGQVVEFDTPAMLLADQKSAFYSLARDAGLVS